MQKIVSTFSKLWFISSILIQIYYNKENYYSNEIYYTYEEISVEMKSTVVNPSIMCISIEQDNFFKQTRRLDWRNAVSPVRAHR